MSKFNIFHAIEYSNIPYEKKLGCKYDRKEFKDKMFADTIKYQRKYGFEIGSGEHATWNNEADAFKHAYMQAFSRYFDGYLWSKAAGIIHEGSNPN